MAAWLQEMSRIRQGQIHYAVVACRLGLMLVAVSGQGLCYWAFGDDPGFLLADLCKSHKNDRVRAGDDDLHRLTTQLSKCLGKRHLPDFIPLDLRGTAFQRQVWQALRQIPPGGTASYAEIARRIGLPKAVRAVASACAANPVSILVPCHRVVRSDGRLSGYHWGAWRKQALLDWEKEGDS